MKVQGRNFDGLLTLFAIVLTLVGCFTILDAGFARSLANSGSAVPHEFKMQILFMIISLIGGVAVAMVPASTWRKLAWPIFTVCMVMIAAVELIGFSMNGAQRWLKLGPIMVQPAEFAKIASILVLAVILVHRKPFQKPKKAPRDWSEKLDREIVPKLLRLWPALLIMAAVYLIEREKDLGTASVVAVTGYLLCWYAGASRFSLVTIALVSLLGGMYMISKEPYRMERITSHAQRWSENHVDDMGYQTTQSETAMASGGFIGTGVGTGRAKYMMPAATTDFVFATVAEETGFIGVAAILGLIGLIVWRLLEMAKSAANPFARYVCAGTAIWLTVQGTTNLMMANGFLPPIGIPFPFVSSGGSSLIALWIAIGLCQSAYCDQEKEVKVVENRRNRRWNRRARLSRA